MTTAASGPVAEEQPAVILVVDDTPATRGVSSSWLRRHGHQVIEAATGAEALDALARMPVDLVVLDTELPDMSGFEVCERIKNDPGLAQPVIHLSGAAIRSDDWPQELTCGADAYLTEPVERDVLLATVAAVLRYYRARAAAEQLADRLTRLTRATLAMNAATSIKALVAAIATGAADIFGTPTVTLVATADGTLRRAVVSGTRHNEAVLDTAPPSLLRQLEIYQGTGPAAATAVFQLPWRLLAPNAPEESDDCCAVLFRSRSDRPPVCVAVRLSALQAEQNDLICQLGHAAVLAADALRLYAEEHNLALTLQRSFLHPGLPELPNLQIAVRYVPASNAEIGGDFYELIELDGGQLLVAIGDVAGHSIHAATVMVELRHALRAYAIEGHGPAEILGWLERVLRHYHPTEFATLCLLLLDPGRNTLTVTNAGHLPPLLVQHASADYLAVHGPMLGLRQEQPPQTVLTLPPSWQLVLITDGLVEDRTADLDTALAQLRAATSLEASPEELCDQLLAQFGQDKHDDIALLVLRRR